MEICLKWSTTVSSRRQTISSETLETSHSIHTGEMEKRQRKVINYNFHESSREELFFPASAAAVSVISCALSHCWLIVISIRQNPRVKRTSKEEKCMPNCQIRQIWLNEILINQFPTLHRVQLAKWELNFTRKGWNIEQQSDRAKLNRCNLLFTLFSLT